MNNELVAWMYQRLGSDKWWVCLGEPNGEVSDRKPLYTHPVKELTGELEKRNDGLWEELKKYIDSKPISLKALTDEVYFCSRCGKRLGDGIHTCTPPADILRKVQENG